MNWLGAEIDPTMVAVRTVHFAATATVAGALLFRTAVAEPALLARKEAGLALDRQIRRLAWGGLAVVILSGALWLLLQTSAMSGESWGEAVASGTMLSVLNETQFGLVSEIRLAFVFALVACLVYDRLRWPHWLGVGAALCLVGSIAWTGHAGSTPFQLGYLHVAADALHLCAAAAWLGGLVGLVLLLNLGRRLELGTSLLLDAILRFSTLGIISVATLMLSGIVNAMILVGSLRGLTTTTYGVTLMLKLVLFVTMVAFATANRFWLTPALELSEQSDAHNKTFRILRQNGSIEIGLALLVFALVGVLGTLHPAAHLVK